VLSVCFEGHRGSAPYGLFSVRQKGGRSIPITIPGHQGPPEPRHLCSQKAYYEAGVLMVCVCVYYCSTYYKAVLMVDQEARSRCRPRSMCQKRPSCVKRDLLYVDVDPEADVDACLCNSLGQYCKRSIYRPSVTS